MALVTQSIKNLKGGISQQPDILRFPNQGKQQINGWSSEVQGLQKRPPSRFIKNILGKDALGAKPLIHLINRDEVEQYFVIFTGSAIRVYGLDGTQYTIRGYDSYGDCTNPRDDLRLITVADYTFVTNRKKVTAVGTELTHDGAKAIGQRAVVNVRGGQYGRTLKFGINGADDHAVLQMPIGDVAAYPSPPAGTPASQVEWTDAGFIAREMSKRFNEKMTTLSLPYTATAGQGWIVIDANGGPDITKITTDDGYASQLISGFLYQVQTFAKLPSACVDGYLAEITGEAGKTGDNYWVQYSASGLVWKEVAKPGIIAGIDGGTMPRALVRAADGQFDWKVLEWQTRQSGDEETNPMPSFIGSTINDVFFYRNRLGFLSGENVIMSRTSKYFSLFPSSVAQVSDDDPIDVAISHSRVSILKYAVPFSEQLLLWSDQAQFVLSSSGTMTSKSIQLDLTTEFDVSDGARPYGIGRGVYYASPRASYTSLKRYYAVQDVSDVKSSEDISGHVPNYLPNTVFSIQGSGTENFVVTLSDHDESKLFIYKFLYQDEQLVQQSWSHWEMGEGTRVLSASCIGSYMYLLIERSCGITMERIDFTSNSVDFPSEPYRGYMDMKTSVVCESFDEDQFESYIPLRTLYGGSLPASSVVYSLDTFGVIERHEAPEGGWGDTLLHFNGDRRGETFVIGVEYQFLYEFSKFLIKKVTDDGGISTEDVGRLQLRRAWLNYEQSGAFDVAVDNGSSRYSYNMSGRRLGSDLTIGSLMLGTGQMRFACTGNALNQTVTITSSNPTPLSVIGGGWEGNYLRRSSGI